MVAFANSMATVGDGAFLETLGSWVDLPTLWATLAVDRAINDWDGMSGFYCWGDSSFCYNHNYYWYEETGRDRFWLVPWDMDLTFDLASPWQTCCGAPGYCEPVSSCDPVPVSEYAAVLPAICDPLFGRMSTLGYDDWSDAARELLDGSMSLAQVESTLSTWEAQIQPFVEEDPNGPGLDIWLWEISYLRENIAALHGRLEQEVAR